MRHILRYHIREALADAALEEIRTFHGRTGVRDVLLFTSSYDFQPSFLPLEELAAYARRMAAWAGQLADDGIRVGVNVLQTLGHVNFPGSLSGAFPFQRRVDGAGEESRGGACPLDEKLREYVSQVYRTFGALKPWLLYVDDDFRSLIGGAGCFCPDHLARIGRSLGRSLTRVELVDAMLGHDADKAAACRGAFHESQVAGLLELAGMIRDAVRETSPATRLGLMVATAPGGLWGHDFLAVARALAGDAHRPLLRPQMGVYAEDGDLRPCAGVFRQPAMVRELYGGQADVQPEIENYTYTTYAKSRRLTLLQMVTPHLDGCHVHLLNLFDMYGSPFRESEPVVRMLEQNRGAFEALADLVPEGARCSGVALWQHPLGHLHHRPRVRPADVRSLIAPRNAEQYVSLLGIPVGFEWDTSPFLMLCGDSVAALGPDELAGLLERNALLDLPALERIIEKGLGDVVGVRLQPALSRDRSVAESFLDVEFCAEHAGRSSPLRNLVEDDWCRPVSALAGSALRPLSVVVDHEGREAGPAVSAVETGAGRRFGILGFALDSVARQMFVTARRCRQIRSLFEWVAGQRLPIAAAEHAFLVPQCVRLPGSEILFALSNYSLDDTDSAVVETDLPLSAAASRLAPDGAWHAAGEDFEEVSPGRFTLRRPVPAFSIVVYRVDPGKRAATQCQNA